MKLDFPVTATIVVAAIAVPLLGIEAPLIASLDAIHGGEVWRLFTGTLVHSSLGQLVRDAIGFAILGAAYEAELGGRFFGLLVAGLVVPVAAVALFQPELGRYYGLSGAVYAFLAFAVVHEWRRAGRRPPVWIVTLALVSMGKLLFEAVTGRLLFPLELGEGVVPATLAHLAGAAVGIAFGALGPIAGRTIPFPDEGSSRFRALT